MKIALSRADFHWKVYLFGLALLVCCLPLSPYLLSISQFLLAINWIVEGNYRQKLRRIRENPAIVLFASIFLLYLFGFLFSENSRLGLEKVKNALPLLLMPIVIGTSEMLSSRIRQRLFLLFSAAVVASALVCVLIYLIKGIPEGSDFRKISVFMSHIRFALLIDMAIFILLYYTFYHQQHTQEQLKRNIRPLLITGLMFLIFFLFFLRSATGLVIFLSVTVLFTIHTAVRNNRKPIRYAVILLISGFIVFLGSATAYVWRNNFTAKPIIKQELSVCTRNGNPYIHDHHSNILENGHYLDLYYCETELIREWNRISSIPYDQNDLKGQPLRSTIKRYLTSKGLHKDSVGLHALNASDIANIEKGYANHKFTGTPGIYQRFYETLWEIHILKESGYVQQHTFGQRIAFYNLAGSLIRENLWIGTGTGDVNGLMLNRAKAKKLSVDPLWEGKPHNQFAFILLAFGITGFVWILICWIFPVIQSKAFKSLLFNMFALLILISMFVLDTMESYDSIVFFSFFYSIMVFGQINNTFINRTSTLLSVTINNISSQNPLDHRRLRLLIKKAQL